MADVTQDELLVQVDQSERTLELFLDRHEGTIEQFPTAYQECVDAINTADAAFKRRELTQVLVDIVIQKVNDFIKLAKRHS